MLPEWFAKLGLMGWPLALCSVAAMTLCLERGVYFLRAYQKRNNRFQLIANELTAHQNQPKQVRDEMVGVMLLELQRSHETGIKPLRIIGSISPMIGLLGTILGIIAAFQVIAVQTGPVSPAMIADGLWEAMLTTAAGLLIALPALLMAHAFKAYSDKQLGDFCLRLNKLSLAFELDKNQQPAEAKHRPAPRIAA